MLLLKLKGGEGIYLPLPVFMQYLAKSTFFSVYR